MNSFRVRLIDSLRGLSLLGILLANLLIFQYGMFGKDELDNLSAVDTGALMFLKIAVEQSFMPIFTLLFGYSLIKFVDSVKKRRAKSRWHLLRRSSGLILLGILHSTFLWEGDILLSYGFMLLFLLPFIYRKAKTVFIWSGILFILTIGMGYGTVEQTQEEKAELAAYVEKEQAVYSTGSYKDIKDFHNNEMPPGFDDPILIVVVLILGPFILAPMFLLGMGLAKVHAFESLKKERKLYALGALLVPIGLACKAFSFVETDWSGMLLQGGSQLLAIGYICLFALVYASGIFSRGFVVFESVGKLSLTNYLMQTVVCTFFFYSYGLGFFGELGVFNSILFGLCLFGIQCILSSWYLSKFKRGPIESLLRIWTNFSWNGHIKDKKNIPTKQAV